MIASLTGEITSRDGEYIVVNVGGVGYLVCASAGALSRLPAKGSANLVIYTDVKENDIALFGFASTLEKQVFLLLKKVKGIGSRMAMTVLSGMGAEPLLAIIANGDLTSLQRIPGIGKKTAERVIVELREQVGEFAAASVQNSASTSMGSTSAEYHEPSAAGDAVLALEKLGFPAERARKAVADAAGGLGAAAKISAGELVQYALGKL